MLLAPIAALALVLSNGAKSPKVADAAYVSASAADLHPPRYEQFPAYDAGAEQELLTLTNRERQRVGLPPLQLDQGLLAAARAHAAAMAAKRELSHQFPGESPLQDRLADSLLHLDKAGENVASDVDVEQAHDGLMRSPHHREILLRADYNVAGFGVARLGDQIYVVEDFGHSLPTYPVAHAEDIIASAIKRARGRSNLSQLKRLQLETLRDAACSMARHDRLNPKAIEGLGPLHYILTYTNMQPELLPADTGKTLDDGTLRSFAVGACYLQTPTYPNGAYWVTLVFY